MKTAIGIVLALLIGGACRYFRIPVPAPPSLMGVVLIAGITAGYIAVDWIVK
jgi:XapX domain-containing protein